MLFLAFKSKGWFQWYPSLILGFQFFIGFEIEFSERKTLLGLGNINCLGWANYKLKFLLWFSSKVTLELSIPLFTFNLIILLNCFLLFCSYEVIDTLKLDKHLVDYSIHYHVFNTLLFCLLVLNIYWWVLMLRMLVGQICAKGKVSEDIRSGKLKIHYIYGFLMWLLDRKRYQLQEMVPQTLNGIKQTIWSIPTLLHAFAQKRV